MTNGDVLYAELSSLLAAARHDLPTLAGVVKHLNGFASDASRNSAGAFTACPQEGGGYGPYATTESGALWSGLCNDLAESLEITSGRLQSAADALFYIAKEYIEVDEYEKRKIQQVWGEYYSDVPEIYLQDEEEAPSSLATGSEAKPRPAPPQ